MSKKLNIGQNFDFLKRLCSKIPYRTKNPIRGWLSTFKCNFLLSIVEFGTKLKDLGVETWVLDMAPNLIQSHQSTLFLNLILFSD